MRHFRIYKLAQRAGRIIGSKEVVAPSKRKAIREAEKDPDCPHCEVWEGSERVGVIDSLKSARK